MGRPSLRPPFEFSFVRLTVNNQVCHRGAATLTRVVRVAAARVLVGLYK